MDEAQLRCYACFLVLGEETMSGPRDPNASVADYPRFKRGVDSCRVYFERLFRERIVIYDGAMGTMIQKYKLSEEQYRVSRAISPQAPATLLLQSLVDDQCSWIL